MNYFEQHHDEYLEGLKAILRIPSISTLTEHKPDIRRAAEFMRDSLTKAGMQNAELVPMAPLKVNPLCTTAFQIATPSSR